MSSTRGASSKDRRLGLSVGEQRESYTPIPEARGSSPLLCTKLPPDCSINQATDPRVLEAIFSRIIIQPHEILCDIGCGDGEVLAFLRHKYPTNMLLGIEIDRKTARRTSYRFESDIRTIISLNDASQPHYARSLIDVFYLFNPFRGEMIRQFEHNLRGTRARIIYNAYHDLSTIWKDWQVEPLSPILGEVAFRAAILTWPRGKL